MQSRVFGACPARRIVFGESSSLVLTYGYMRARVAVDISLASGLSELSLEKRPPILPAEPSAFLCVLPIFRKLHPVHRELQPGSTAQRSETKRRVQLSSAAQCSACSAQQRSAFHFLQITPSSAQQRAQLAQQRSAVHY